MNYLGIDLGTSSVKGLLLSDTNEVLTTVSAEYPNDVDSRGYSEQNPDDWYEKSIEVLTELINKSKEQIGGISFSGQMHGLVCLDQADNVIRPAILWNDQRTIDECTYLNTEIGTDFLIEHTGNIALTGYTAPKILWLQKNEPENFARISKIMLPKDYLAYKLTGVLATDYSDASGTLYFDVENRCWSKAMLEILKINEEQLPKVHNSFSVIGNLKLDVKKKLGLNYDIEVAIGGGDQAVGSIGTATVEHGDVNISLGTSGVVFIAMDSYQKDPTGTLHTFCDATGKFHKMGVALNSGGSLKWWTEEIISNQDFKQLNQEMLQIAPTEKLYFLPYLIGERSPINDSRIRGSFVGLSLHHNQAAMTRSIIEGVAFSIRQMYDASGLKGNAKIKITGGGAKSELWVQILADVLKQEITMINALEGPAFGAALLAKAAVTNRKIEEIAKKAVVVTKTVCPSSNQEVYQDKYHKWLKIYPQLKELEL